MQNKEQEKVGIINLKTASTEIKNEDFIIQKNNNRVSKIYRRSVAIRSAIAGTMIPFGHIVLEPFGVPHGIAEEISLMAAGVLFAPEMITMNAKITIETTRLKINNLLKKDSK